MALGASTSVRKWRLEVNDTGSGGTYASPVWVTVYGRADFQPFFTPSTVDASDLDSSGAKSKDVLAYEWGCTFKLKRKVTTADATAYDPGQEIIRAAGNAIGTDNILDIRFYEVTTSGPTEEAYRGYVSVSWSPDGGAMDADDMVSVTLDGHGERTAITHPSSVSAVPVVSSVSPSAVAAAGGDPVMIYGSYFTGVTAVKVGAGGTAFTDYNFVDDHHIVGVVPAKAAGTYVIEVTNANGASSGGATVTYS